MTTWHFTLYGQPPSWNASYHIVKRFRYGSNGKRIPFHTLAKKDAVIEYQAHAKLIIKSARPSRWAPEGQVRVWYWLHLAKDIDCDNVMKAIHDALQDATGVDDKMFLPVVVMKETGCSRKDARVEVVVEDPVSPSLAPPSWSIIPGRSSIS